MPTLCVSKKLFIVFIGILYHNIQQLDSFKNYARILKEPARKLFILENLECISSNNGVNFQGVD